MADLDILHSIDRQYGATLAMLRKAIEECPDSLWLSKDYPNRFWHITYHALFYTHFYLQKAAADFRAWENHRPDYQYLAKRADIPYTRAELMEYHAFCRGDVDARVPALDLTAPSGFDWLPFDKLQLQLYNLRHLAHHTGQLADRLRTAAKIGVAWGRQ